MRGGAPTHGVVERRPACDTARTASSPALPFTSTIPDTLTPACTPRDLGLRILSRACPSRRVRPAAAGATDDHAGRRSNGRSLRRVPAACASAFASAAAMGPCAASATPSRGSPGRSIKSTSIRSGTPEKRMIG